MTQTEKWTVYPVQTQIRLNINLVQGHRYHTDESAFAYTFEPKTWDYSINPSSECFLMIGIQNVGENPILICLILILTGAIYDGIICSMTLFEGFAANNEVKNIPIHYIFKIKYCPPLPKLFFT